MAGTVVLVPEPEGEGESSDAALETSASQNSLIAWTIAIVGLAGCCFDEWRSRRRDTAVGTENLPNPDEPNDLDSEPNLGDI